jgi:hypothetical protein
VRFEHGRGTVLLVYNAAEVAEVLPGRVDAFGQVGSAVDVNVGVIGLVMAPAIF